MTIEDHKIKMLFNNGEKSFNSNDNTIISENKYNFIKRLKVMIKFHCFNQKIKQLIQRPYSELPNNQKGTKVAYLINKKIILDYKEYFEYNTLFLEKNNEIIKIKEKNNFIDNKILTDDVINKIIKNLKEIYINKIKEKKTFDIKNNYI